MSPEDKKEFLELFKQSFERIVLPTIVDIHRILDRITQFDCSEDQLDDNGKCLVDIEHKLNTVVDEQDKQA
ncbi:MAG: hypothetical protein KGZ93_00220 [Actinobacteria bacterium]|nr:hypothetical protein [Actinomycetota bacterium]